MFTPAVERALCVSLEAHAGQCRKGSDVPYAVHPLHVALIVARWGCDDETIQAALLHDVVEDCPQWGAERIRAEFGEDVLSVVLELTEDKGLSWEERKEHAIESIPGLSARACAVKAADKLHNLFTLAGALAGASDPALVWARFKGGRERTLAKDRRLVAALAGRLSPDPARELSRALAAVEAAA
jgi:(p)ppGpp synthase/HD superfamily hydrolase